MTPILTYLSAQLITQIGNIHGSDAKQYYFLSIAIISAQILLSLFIGAAKSLLFSPWLAKESILIEKSLTELFNAKMTRIRMQCFNNPEFVTEKDMANKKRKVRYGCLISSWTLLHTFSHLSVCLVCFLLCRGNSVSLLSFFPSHLSFCRKNTQKCANTHKKYGT